MISFDFCLEAGNPRSENPNLHGPARSRLLALLAFCALLVGVAGESRAAHTTWTLYSRDERPVARFAGGPHQVPCGSYGLFELEFEPAVAASSTTGSLVTVQDQGEELPPDYPLLTSEAPEALFEEQPGWGRGHKGSPSALTASAPLPCANGSCFSRPGTVPWVAVIDWDNWHGWSVGKTILEASSDAVRVALFPVDDPAFTADFGERVTDVHLLAQLCHVAEAIEDPNVVPPLAVSMSLGRAHHVGDASDGQCDSTTLSCQIGRVMDHLQSRSLELAPARANPTQLLASAGNHGELLFPSSYEPVISVGALDLQDFHQRGGARPSWETPFNADALFPGYGVCLEYSTPSGQSVAWPAPPGSSFSAAMMTGWLAPSLATQKLPEGRGRWAPTRRCWGRRCTYSAAKSGKAYGKTGRGAQDIVESTGSDQESPCSPSSSGSEITLAATLGSPLSLRALPRLSLPQSLPSLLLPSPAPASCVPCEERQRLNRGNGKQKAVFPDEPREDDTEGGQTLAGIAGASHRTTPETLEIQLWAGRSMDWSLVLSDLYLRVESLLYPVELTRRDLHRLESGEIEVLTLDLGRSPLPKDHQPSLVWVLRGPRDTGGEVELWTSTPILLRSQ